VSDTYDETRKKATEKLICDHIPDHEITQIGTTIKYYHQNTLLKKTYVSSGDDWQTIVKDGTVQQITIDGEVFVEGPLSEDERVSINSDMIKQFIKCDAVRSLG